MSRAFAVALALAFAAALVSPALGQNYSCGGPSGTGGNGAWCYEKCVVCTKGDPTKNGGEAGGWDTGSKYNINLDFARGLGCFVLTPQLDDKGKQLNQQECAEICVAKNQTGFIESKQGNGGTGTDYCVCCSEFCHELQEKAASYKNGTKALQFTTTADYKKASKCLPGEAEHDPHFVGAHGTRYDFNGQPGKTYNLVSTKDFQLNVKLIGYALDGSDSLHTPAAFEAGKQFVRTWMGEMGFLWTDAEGQQHSLHLMSRRSKVTSAPGLMAEILLDGAPVDFSSTPGNVLEVAGARLDYLGTSNERPAVGETEKWLITIGDVVTVGLKLDPAHPFIRTPEDAMTHFSLALKHLKVSDQVHGVLGQTFRSSAGQVMKAIQYKTLNALLKEPIRADGVSGAGFLDGSAQDYVTSGVLEADCKYCMFSNDA